MKHSLSVTSPPIHTSHPSCSLSNCFVFAYEKNNCSGRPLEKHKVMKRWKRYVPNNAESPQKPIMCRSGNIIRWRSRAVSVSDWRINTRQLAWWSRNPPHLKSLKQCVCALSVAFGECHHAPLLSAGWTPRNISSAFFLHTHIDAEKTNGSALNAIVN